MSVFLVIETGDLFLGLGGIVFALRSRLRRHAPIKEEVIHQQHLTELIDGFAQAVLAVSIPNPGPSEF